MCQFFSFLTDEKGNVYHMDREIRGKIHNKESDLREDSHASIAVYHHISEDDCNKYEYDPITKKLLLDTQNLMVNDRELIDLNMIEELIKEAVPELKIKPIIHPFKDVEFDGEITDDIIELVRKWSKVSGSVRGSVSNSVLDSVRNSVRDSVRNSVFDSVWNSVEYSVRNSVFDSVWNSVEYSIWYSVRDLVRDSVEYSIWYSVRDSIWSTMYAYVASFFDLKSWKYVDSKSHVNPFQSCIDLWNMGLVPSFDGEVWRLHSHTGVVWEGKL